jgi:hypothetical protein
VPIVEIHGFHGTFSGASEYEYQHPEVGASQKCMLFFAQQKDEQVAEAALAECAKYGFAGVEFSGHGPLKVEVLNTPQFKGFAGFYEEALREGSALVSYPN